MQMALKIILALLQLAPTLFKLFDKTDSAKDIAKQTSEAVKNAKQQAEDNAIDAVADVNATDDRVRRADRVGQYIDSTGDKL